MCPVSVHISDIVSISESLSNFLLRINRSLFSHEVDVYFMVTTIHHHHHPRSDEVQNDGITCAVLQNDR